MFVSTVQLASQTHDNQARTVFSEPLYRMHYLETVHHKSSIVLVEDSFLSFFALSFAGSLTWHRKRWRRIQNGRWTRIMAVHTEFKFLAQFNSTVSVTEALTNETDVSKWKCHFMLSAMILAKSRR